MAADPGRPSALSKLSTTAKLIVALAAAGVLGAGLLMPVVLGTGLVGKHYSAKFLNTTCDLRETAPPEPTTLYARDGKTVIARLFTQDRKLVPLSDVPKSLIDALIATEDRRFYDHHGVDMRGLIRSAVSTSGGDTQGGSTLTMQYVKQVQLYQAGDNIAKQKAAIAVNLQRKMEDAQCAIQIEKRESKAQILDNYLNIAFFGEHAYSVEVAAETYFGVPASKLTLGQSAMLVGLLRAPSAYDPYQYPAAAKQRRDEVLQNMVSDGKLSQAEADKVAATPISLAAQNPPTVNEGCANADTTVPNAAFFCYYTENWLRNVQGLSQQQLQTGGLKIITTLDPSIQTSAQQNITKSVPATSPMTAVLPVLDPSTGNILAMAASKTYGAGKGQTEQPIFTADTTSSASTFKLFPMLTALSTGMPPSFELNTAGKFGSYSTKNCATPGKTSNGDEQVNYDALQTLSQATATSSNTYYLSLADTFFDCKLQPIVSLMSKMGMQSMQQPSDVANQTVAQTIVGAQRAQQLVLGSVPTNPLELAGAYAVVAGGGRYNTPAPVSEILQGTTQIPVKRKASVQVVSPQTAAYAAQVLRGDSQPGGTSADVFDRWYSDHPTDYISGKTGTNESTKKNENGSLWYVGLTPKLVGAAAVINFDAPSAPTTGLPHYGRGQAYGDFATSVWFKALRPSLTAENSWTWPDPQQVDGNPVPSLSGLTYNAAKKLLAQNGFQITQLDAADALTCPSSVTYDSIAYWGPTIAPSGSTITVCPSSQTPAYVPPAPIIRRPTRGNGNSNGNGNSRPGSGGSTTSPTTTPTTTPTTSPTTGPSRGGPTPPRGNGH